MAEKVEKPKPGEGTETETVSPEAVMAMALLKADLEKKPVDIDGISGLFYFNPVVRSLTRDAPIALRRVPGGGISGRGVFSGDVEAFVICLIASGCARYGENGSVELFPDGLRICFLILVDETKTNPDGLDALAAAMDFKISTLLRCFDEKWLR